MRSEVVAVVLLRQWSRSSIRSARFSSLTARRDQNVLSASVQSTVVPFRKQLKEEAKRKRAAGRQHDDAAEQTRAEGLAQWELTVGIEIHAQLNTERKLFSSATTSSTDEPNAHCAIFDVSSPGSQPEFQTATLLPALRAALALNCNIQRRSKFDRKHYFYQDQPAGYQITQYHAPFAKDGYIRLSADDGIAPEDGESITIGIKQIQMEQDTAKTIQQPPDGSLLDFNRVGHPLIEIITLPQMHHPQTAAACVKKIQQVLQAVSSVTTGMELGGLRADVNVSVLPRSGERGNSSYHGIGGLGTRTEIKNLSSFKAIEDAIIVERGRQIEVLESGGVIEGETRGWTLGSNETRRLRGKEGEVDYRYMPDPDLPPLLVGQSLVSLLKESLPMLPEEQIDILINQYGLTMKDSKTLIALEGGSRLDYFQAVLSALPNSLVDSKGMAEIGRVVGNWTLHELGGLLTKSETEFKPENVPPKYLAGIIENLLEARITGKTAKQLLGMIFNGDERAVEGILDEENLRIRHLSDEEYGVMAAEVIEQNPDMAEKVRAGQKGKLQWLVGQMMRQGKGRVDAQRATAALTPLLEPN